MLTRSRVLAPEPVPDLNAAAEAGWGDGLDAAVTLGPAGVIEELEASGLRGRGGAGFPTGRKWRTVALNASPALPTAVVVNAAEGEPGSFKDRAILRRNPYRVLEGALIAAHAVGADAVVVALKASFSEEAARVRQAIEEIERARQADGIGLTVFEGPNEYLYGEETALLEAIDGREPFPRVAPPFRHGVDELGDGEASAADVEMAAPGDATAAPPALVNNVETIANVPAILADGPDAFRSIGTSGTPGTVVCTVTGRTRRHGVGEFPTGTPLRSVIEALGDGARPGRRITAVLSGVAHPFLPADLLETPVDFDALDAVGAGLGAAGFIVFDDATDLVAVAQGVSRFLAIESCGQCTPCKQDGLALSDLLDRVRRSDATDLDLVAIGDRARTVADGARCFLAHQHQRVVGSLLELFPGLLAAHLDGHVGAAEPELIAPIVDFDGDRAVLDETHPEKHADWTTAGVDSGRSPADRLGRTPDSG
ncbi:MAG TPA: NADH-ubiquinone oxidoreductase-F iron-sulfur binding region domain-containing protein [Acidimicrobiia bacterium]